VRIIAAMKRIVISLIAGLMVGTAIGFALGIFVYPFWFLRDVATEQLPPAVGEKLASGTFRHANPSDPVHWGKGTVTLHRQAPGDFLLHLTDDFEVGPGPRFHVYLVEAAPIDSGDDFKASGGLDLGRLRAFKGSQVYSIPPGTELGRYRSVVIWCKEFGVLISPATLDSLVVGQG
jgi:hypothetical protein